MTQHRAAYKALTLLTGLVVTLARRRPAKFPAHAADAALDEFRLARLHIQRGLAIYEKYQGALRNAPTDRVGEAAEA